MQTSAVPADLAYAAGVIDSDGYIGVHRSTYAMRVRGDASQAVYMPRVQVKQVTPQAIDFLHGLFGGHRYDGKPTAKRGRPLLGWTVHSAMAVRVCEELLPYLRIKREQELNVIEVGGLNSSSERRRFVLPEVDPDEPMVTMAEAARRLGKSYEVVIQSVRKGNVPHLRLGPRKVLIPESYLPIWADRGRAATRCPDITERLEACFQRAKDLNRVGA
jgi:excisionase family DNA binding protein